jgi:protein-disulfide isomerase
VRGTPTLFIGGKKVQSRSVEGMSAMIDALLKESKKEG